MKKKFEKKKLIMALVALVRDLDPPKNSNVDFSHYIYWSIKKIFKENLKELIDWELRMEAGKLFHKIGPATLINFPP